MTHENFEYGEPENRNGHGSAVLAGVLVGGLTGALTALLLAPQSGKETRSQIQGKVKHVRDRVHHLEGKPSLKGCLVGSLG